MNVRHHFLRLKHKVIMDTPPCFRFLVRQATHFRNAVNHLPQITGRSAQRLRTARDLGIKVELDLGLPGRP